MKIAICLLLLGCILAFVAGLADDNRVAGDSEHDGFPMFNRFGRALSQADSGALSGYFPLYFIPTQQQDLCQGPNCCQADDYASPYRIQHLNASTTTWAGRQYTTFFLRLVRQEYCDQAADSAGCCEGDVQTLWVDVDPRHLVVHASFNGSSSAIEVEQSMLGFKMSLSSPLTNVASSGQIVTITVAGEVSQLCALSDLAPVYGLCSIIAEGGTPRNSAACCPHSLSLVARGSYVTPDNDSLACVEAHEASSVDMILQSVTQPFMSLTNQLLSNYTFVLKGRGACTAASAANSCCDMDINIVEMDLNPGVMVQAVEISGQMVPFDVSTDRMQVGNLAITADMISKMELGLPLIVSVALPANSKAVPRLCTNEEYGLCSYSLTSTNRFCCPTDKTGSVLLGNNVLSPPPLQPPNPPGFTAASPPPSILAQPPPPGEENAPSPILNLPPFPPVDPGSCQPETLVPLVQTSMALQYYEGPGVVGPHSSFTFLVSNHNNGSCTEPICQDVCGWTLFIRPDLASSLSIVAEEANDADNHFVDSGANASITFEYGPKTEGTLLYTILAPRATNLASLCRPNALPGQGAKACAAIVRGPLVYSVIFFDQADVIIAPPPPTDGTTPLPGGETCLEQRPLEESCVRPNRVLFNHLNGDLSVFDFQVSDHDSGDSAGCFPPMDNVQFMVMLTASAAPAVYETIPASSVGAQWVAWSWPTSNQPGMAVQHGVSFKGMLNPSQVCAQNQSHDQPAGSCAVAILGATCFLGFVTPSKEESLECTWCHQYISEREGGGSSSGATIGIAVGVVVGVFLLGTLLFFVLFSVRKRRRNNNAAAAAAARINIGSGWDSFDSLAAPLTGAAHGAGGSISGNYARSLVSSRAASDVLVRLPASPTQ